MRADLQYPDYYKTVVINYIDQNGTIRADKAWLAVNDNLEYIWTLTSDDTTVIPDDYVDNWREI